MTVRYIVGASGWHLDAEGLRARRWDGGQRHRVEVDLFGTELRPQGPRRRWVKQVAA